MDGKFVKDSILSEFPLLETHIRGFHYAQMQDLPDEDAMLSHSTILGEILKDIVDAGLTDQEGIPSYKVLTVGEEYIIMELVGLPRSNQMLTTIDGVPYDVFTPNGQTVRFDVSAFFGRD